MYDEDLSVLVDTENLFKIDLQSNTFTCFAGNDREEVFKVTTMLTRSTCHQIRVLGGMLDVFPSVICPIQYYDLQSFHSNEQFFAIR